MYSLFHYSMGHVGRQLVHVLHQRRHFRRVGIQPAGLLRRQKKVLIICNIVIG